MIDGVPFAVVSGALIAAGIATAWLRPSAIVARPRTLLALVALVSIGAAAAVFQLDYPWLRIHLDPSSEPLLPVRDPGQEVYRKAVLDFGSDDIYVVAMETNDVFTRAHLETLRGVTDGIRKLEGVSQAESLVEVYAFRYDETQDRIEIGKFIDEIPSDPAELADLRARALSDPLYPKVIVSADGRAAAVNVTFRPMTDGEFVSRDLDGRIATLLAEASRDGVRFYVSGRPHIRSEAHHLMVRDLLLLIPIAVAIANVLLWLMTGSFRATLIPLGSCLTGTLWAFAAMSLVGKQLNIITLVLGPMLICVGTVYGIHVLARYESFSAQSKSPREAALRTLEYASLPVMIAGLTTCVGFGALMLADVQATNELGAFSMLGIACVTVLSVTAVPALLALLPLEESRALEGEPVYMGRTRLSAWAGRGIDVFLAAIGRLDVRYPTAILSGWAVLAVAAALLIPRIVIDTDFLTVFDPDTKVRTDFAQVNRLLAGAVPIYVVLQGAEEGTFRRPEVLRAIEALQRDIEAVPGVSHALSAADLVRVANRALEGGRPGAYRIPDTRMGVAEAVFTIPKEQMRRLATSNHSSANIVVRTGSLGSAAVREVEAGIRKLLARHRLPDRIRADVTGNSILINKSADGISRNQVIQVGSAALTILVLVTIGFRSLRVALLSMIPNILPVVLFFGALGAGAATLSIATALIGSIALGIAIDDTVHFLVAYLRERRAGRASEEAATHCVKRIGRPIAMTSIMIVVGFLVLLVSGFVTLREFGYLTAMTMAICLMTDLLLFPALLVRVRA